MRTLCLRSVRFTPISLNAWRRAHRLYVREMAFMLGIPTTTLKDKLYGRGPIRLRVDRELGNIDLMLAAGIRPEGWPDRLARRIVVTRIDYIETMSTQTCDDTPEKLI
jgi:hypothetical protein